MMPLHNSSKKYLHAIAWIALNDESAEKDVIIISELPSVMLIASMFNLEELKVAKDVLASRELSERNRQRAAQTKT